MRYYILNIFIESVTSQTKVRIVEDWLLGVEPKRLDSSGKNVFEDKDNSAQTDEFDLREKFSSSEYGNDEDHDYNPGLLKEFRIESSSVSGYEIAVELYTLVKNK